MIKWMDGVRLTATANEARGIRNGTYARLGETYLIIAEAYGRKGDYANAKKHMDKALRMGTQNAKLLAKASVIEKAAGNDKSAGIYMEKSKKINPYIQTIQQKKS